MLPAGASFSGESANLTSFSSSPARLLLDVDIPPRDFGPPLFGVSLLRFKGGKVWASPPLTSGSLPVSLSIRNLVRAYSRFFWLRDIPPSNPAYIIAGGPDNIFAAPSAIYCCCSERAIRFRVSGSNGGIWLLGFAGLLMSSYLFCEAIMPMSELFIDTASRGMVPPNEAEPNLPPTVD